MRKVIIIFGILLFGFPSFSQEVDDLGLGYYLGVSYRSPRIYYGQLNPNPTTPVPSNVLNYHPNNFSGVGIAGEVRYKFQQFIIFYNPIIRFDRTHRDRIKDKIVNRFIFDQNAGIMFNRKINFGVGMGTMNTFNKIDYVLDGEVNYFSIRIPSVLFMAEIEIDEYIFHLDLIHIDYGMSWTNTNSRSIAFQLRIYHTLPINRGR